MDLPLNMIPAQIFQEKLQCFLGQPVPLEAKNEKSSKYKQFTGVLSTCVLSISCSYKPALLQKLMNILKYEHLDKIIKNLRIFIRTHGSTNTDAR